MFKTRPLPTDNQSIVRCLSVLPYNACLKSESTCCNIPFRQLTHIYIIRDQMRLKTLIYLSLYTNVWLNYLFCDAGFDLASWDLPFDIFCSFECETML